MIHNETYCSLKPLGTYFNNKPLYKCDYCGLTLGVEDPNTKILCFKKMEDITQHIHNMHHAASGQNSLKNLHTSGNSSIKDIVFNDLEKEAALEAKRIIEHNKNQQNHSDENLCTQEQIEQRLAICKTCEYFKNNSCLLCGCTVVREANHKNKLAHKDQKCPANKWDIIKT